jgi:hypothetical protein
MRCKVQDCTHDAVARGMCMMHYMRVRRTGDSDIKGKPGPKPREATTPRQEIATRREQVASLRAENARLVESAL